MIVIVGKRCVNVSKAQAILGSNLVGRPAHPLVPDYNVPYGDPMPCNVRLVATHARRNLYMAKSLDGHGTSLRDTRQLPNSWRVSIAKSRIVPTENSFRLRTLRKNSRIPPPAAAGPCQAQSGPMRDIVAAQDGAILRRDP